MKIVFRTDASIAIGAGHVMRCLTLGKALAEKGAEVVFICRVHAGNLIERIRNEGFHVYTLPLTDDFEQSHKGELHHSNWLGASQIQDACECRPIIEAINPEWLVVDHYALDKNWQEELRPLCQKILVIDDLGDREHNCDLLLDQNYGSTTEKYLRLVPSDCKVLVGTQFSLLRPEFASWRQYSLQRRKFARLKNILITLGGVDAENFTGRILLQLQKISLPEGSNITVVMGELAPNIKNVEDVVASMQVPTRVKINVINMAELMANSDLAIGASGATTWERCCLGLPAIQLIIAENQRNIAQSLASSGCVLLLDKTSDLPDLMTDVEEKLTALSNNSAKLTDGNGVRNIVTALNVLTSYSINGYELIPYSTLSKEDLSFVLKMRNHQDVRRWMYSQEVISNKEHLSFVSSLLTCLDKRFFMVKCDDQIIGTINFTGIDYEQKSAEFGIYANPFLKASGRGKALIGLACDYAKQTLGLEQLTLEVFQDNSAAVGLYTKFGFEETKFFVQAGVSVIHMAKELNKREKNEDQ